MISSRAFGGGGGGGGSNRGATCSSIIDERRPLPVRLCDRPTNDDGTATASSRIQSWMEDIHPTTTTTEDRQRCRRDGAHRHQKRRRTKRQEDEKKKQKKKKKPNFCEPLLVMNEDGSNRAHRPRSSSLDPHRPRQRSQLRHIWTSIDNYSKKETPTPPPCEEDYVNLVASMCPIGVDHEDLASPVIDSDTYALLERCRKGGVFDTNRATTRLHSSLVKDIRARIRDIEARLAVCMDPLSLTTIADRLDACVDLIALTHGCPCGSCENRWRDDVFRLFAGVRDVRAAEPSLSRDVADNVAAVVQRFRKMNGSVYCAVSSGGSNRRETARILWRHAFNGDTRRFLRAMARDVAHAEDVVAIAKAFVDTCVPSILSDRKAAERAAREVVESVMCNGGGGGKAVNRERVSKTLHEVLSSNPGRSPTVIVGKYLSSLEESGDVKSSSALLPLLHHTLSERALKKYPAGAVRRLVERLHNPRYKFALPPIALILHNILATTTTTTDNVVDALNALEPLAYVLADIILIGFDMERAYQLRLNELQRESDLTMSNVRSIVYSARPEESDASGGGPHCIAYLPSTQHEEPGQALPTVLTREPVVQSAAEEAEEDRPHLTRYIQPELNEEEITEEILDIDQAAATTFYEQPPAWWHRLTAPDTIDYETLAYALAQVCIHYVALVRLDNSGGGDKLPTDRSLCVRRMLAAIVKVRQHKERQLVHSRANEIAARLLALGPPESPPAYVRFGDGGGGGDFGRDIDMITVRTALFNLLPSNDVIFTKEDVDAIAAVFATTPNNDTTTKCARNKIPLLLLACVYLLAGFPSVVGGGGGERKGCLGERSRYRAVGYICRRRRRRIQHDGLLSHGDVARYDGELASVEHADRMFVESLFVQRHRVTPRHVQMLEPAVEARETGVAEALELDLAVVVGDEHVMYNHFQFGIDVERDARSTLVHGVFYTSIDDADHVLHDAGPGAVG